MPRVTRIFYLLLSWIIAGSIYLIIGSIDRNSWVIEETFIDKSISFNPIGVWLYLSFYIYIPFTFFFASDLLIKRLSFSIIIGSILSGVLFLLFPSTIVYPHYEITNVSAYLLKFIENNDTEQNCFPSMHGLLITLCTIANFKSHSKNFKVLIILLTFMMYYSIIQVRRHVFIDLATGIFLAIIVWISVHQLLRKILKS